MNVNFNGYNQNVLTFIADSGITEPGVPVKMSDDGTVTVCGANEVFCGVCVGLRGGYAAVQLSGYARFATNSKITVGFQQLAAAANGKIAVKSGGRKLLVVDSTATEAGVIL